MEYSFRPKLNKKYAVMESIVVMDCFDKYRELFHNIQIELEIPVKSLAETVDEYLPQMIMLINEMDDIISKSSNSLRKKDLSNYNTFTSAKNLLTAYLLTSNPTDEEVLQIFNLKT